MGLFNSWEEAREATENYLRTKFCAEIETREMPEKGVERWIAVETFEDGWEHPMEIYLYEAGEVFTWVETE